MPSAPFYERHRRQPSIPTAQARLQGLQADPRRLADALAAHKSPCKTSASTAVRRLALMGQRNQKAYALFTFITRFARLNKQRSGDFRLFPPANFANSAILPTDKISAFFTQNFLLQKPKDSSWLCPKPHRALIVREQGSRIKFICSEGRVGFTQQCCGN